MLLGLEIYVYSVCRWQSVLFVTLSHTLNSHTHRAARILAISSGISRAHRLFIRAWYRAAASQSMCIAIYARRCIYSILLSSMLLRAPDTVRCGGVAENAARGDRWRFIGRLLLFHLPPPPLPPTTHFCCCGAHSFLPHYLLGALQI